MNCSYPHEAYHREEVASRLGSGVAVGKGVITILAQNRPHEVYGRDSVGNLLKTLSSLYRFYNNAQQDDVLICHDGDFDADSQRRVVGRRGATLSFFLLEGENWRVYPDSAASPLAERVARFPDGYRKMMRWYAIRIWPALQGLGYTWVMRLDDDSEILSPIPYNLFAFMEQNNLLYAYRNLAFESGWTGDALHDWVRSFVATSSSGYGWLKDHCDPGARFDRPSCGELLGFYNNFFIGHIPSFLSEPVQTFLRAMDESGMIFTKRWNDLVIQSLAVQLYLPQSAVHHFTGWTYRHASGQGNTLKPYGIYQVGRNATPPSGPDGRSMHSGEIRYFNQFGQYTAAYPKRVDRHSPGVC